MQHTRANLCAAAAALLRKGSRTGLPGGARLPLAALTCRCSSATSWAATVWLYRWRSQGCQWNSLDSRLGRAGRAGHDAEGHQQQRRSVP